MPGRRPSPPPSPSLISASEAAERLGVSSQTIRNWAKTKKVKARKVAGKYWVELSSVGATRLPDAPAGEPSSIHEARLKELEARVDQLAAAQASGADSNLSAAEAERDRSRAEASSAREAALRVNAASEELAKAVRGLLDVLTLQSDALRQLLAPASLEDLPGRD